MVDHRRDRRGAWSRARRVGLLAGVFILLFSSTPASANESPPGGEAVAAPGQEELVADMLGRGATLPGDCALTAGRIDGAAITGTYACRDGEVVVELRHPGNAPAAALQTSRFAIRMLSGSPPAALAATLESRIRSREADFTWSWLLPPPPTAAPSSSSALDQSPSASASSPAALRLLTAAGLIAVAALVWRLALWVRRPRSAHQPPRDRQVHLEPLLPSERLWVIAIFVASALARGWLSLVNRESNDDHGIVAQMIRDGGWLPPASSACWSCSHPKLYHYALAITSQFVGGDGRLVGNLLNFAACTALLVVLYVFSRTLRCSAPVRILAFAFVSFNAAVVGIFSMSTNDGFCILFSSLAIFYLARFFAGRALKSVIAATVFAVLAALSKASGWAIFAAGAAVLCTMLLAADGPVRKTYAAAAAVFVLGFLLVVPFTSPYRQNIAQAGTPFVNDAFKTPFMEREVPRAPVGWAVEAFLTFRIVELLRDPFIDFGEGPYPLHRVSLWSQLYGRSVFLRFDRGIWQNMDPQLLVLGRLCLMLGLLPLTALLIGAADVAASTARGVTTQGRRWLTQHPDWQHLVYSGVMLAALVALVIRYHRLAILFAWMKAIYLLPALLSGFALLLRGLELLWRRYPRVVTGWMAAAVAVSIADMAWLIHDVARSSAQ